MPLRPRKKKWHAAKFKVCKRCGGRVRQHIARCKKCSESN